MRCTVPFGGFRDLPARCLVCEAERVGRIDAHAKAVRGEVWLLECRAAEPLYVADHVLSRLADVLAYEAGGVWVSGKTASGKSTLARAWVRHLAGLGIARALYAPEDEIITGDKALLAELAEVPALAIDGLGTAVEIAPWQRQKLEALIDRRLLGGRTLITSPVRLKSECGSLPLPYGDVLLSRCRRFTDGRRLYLGVDQ